MTSHLDPGLAATIRRVPAWVGLKPEAVIPLTAGITNRNFRVDIGGGSYVVRLFGQDTELLGIDRTAEWKAARAAAEAGVGPEVVAFLPEHRALVTRFLDADSLRPEDVEREDVLVLDRVARRCAHSITHPRARAPPALAGLFVFDP